MVVIVAGAALAAFVLLDVRTWFLLPLVATIAWLAWAIWVWPRVMIESDGVTIRNTFTTCEIPFSVIDSARAGLTLQIRTSAGTRANAFGVHGQTGMARDAMRTAHAHGGSIVPVRRVDDLRPVAATTQASQVAQIIMHRVAVLEDRHSERMRRRPNVTILAVTAALLIIDALVLLVTYG